MPAFINDGYTQRGYIAERKGLHEAVRFTHRLLSHAERAAVAEVIRTQSPAKASKAIATAIKSRVSEWDIKAKPSDEKPVEITPENLARLNPSLFDRLFNVIASYDVSDPEPGAETTDEVDAEAALEALLDGKSEAAAASEGDLKNS